MIVYQNPDSYTQSGLLEHLVCFGPSYGALPYINGISQPLPRPLQKHDNLVVSKRVKILQQVFPSP